MAEAKAKKIRVYKLASEYNLSADSIVEFLSGGGFKVKSHSSNLNDEMIAAVQEHFKKDIEKTQKHYQKLAEFKKIREDKARKDEDDVEEEDVEAVDEIKETEEVKVSDVPAEKEKVVAKETKDKKKKVEEEKVEDKEKEKTDEKKSKPRGLKVVGKMDLGESKKEKEKSDAKAKDAKDKELVKKKRKRKPKKKAGEAVVDETPAARKRKKVKKFEIDQRDVKEAIRKTMLSMEDSSASGRASARKRKRKEREEKEDEVIEQKSLEKNLLKVNEYIAVNELANLMNVPVADVISKCIELGLMVSINQRLDLETITLVADEFEFEIELQEEFTAEALEDVEDPLETLERRPPVVTIMGHVDHGKTSLLDHIRKENVVAGESGGITQHIGAYKVDVGGSKQITFLDTPGHEAFTAMRARGAQLTDIVVLIVAADDAVMPQTVEAINHSLAAEVPIVIAINKIDKPGANIEKIKQQLADRNILIEEWGGKYQCVEISAKAGLNIDQLLEKILLEAEMLDLKANPDRNTRGIVIESELDKGKGITGTILVQKGTL